MRRQLPRMLLCTVLFAAIATTVCGGGAGSPSSPSASGPAANTPPLGKTYMGSVSLASVTGLLMVRAGTGLASIARSTILTKWLDLIEPRLLAQAASTGTLMLNDGRAISLTGSYNGNNFELSGSGYSVTVSVSGNSLAGSVTAPFGTGTVGAIAYSGPANVPGNPAGEYVGTYSIPVAGFFNNRTISTGVLTRSCDFRVTASGTLSVFVQDNGDIDVLDNWQEVTRIVAPCPTVTDFSEQTIRPAGPAGGRFPSERPQILFGWVDRGNHNGGVGVRTTSFIGAINGTTIEGRLVKSWVFTAIVANGTEEAREGYPASEAMMTLRKR